MVRIIWVVWWIYGETKKKRDKKFEQKKIKSPLCGRISRGWENGDGDGLLLRRVSFLVGPDPARERWRDREKIDGMGVIFFSKKIAQFEMD